MPLYEVHHCVKLERSELDALAQRITNLHCSTFETPSLFVNIRFVFEDPDSTTPLYVGGQPRYTNYILGHVRHGPARPRKLYNDIARGLTESWDSVVGQRYGNKGEVQQQDGATGSRHLNGLSKESAKLHVAFVLGEMLAAYEEGLVIPEAGQDKEWLKSIYLDLEKGAQGGNADYRNLLEELKSKGWNSER